MFKGIFIVCCLLSANLYGAQQENAAPTATPHELSAAAALLALQEKHKTSALRPNTPLHEVTESKFNHVDSSKNFGKLRDFQIGGKTKKKKIRNKPSYSESYERKMKKKKKEMYHIKCPISDCPFTFPDTSYIAAHMKHQHPNGHLTNRALQNALAQAARTARASTPAPSMAAPTSDHTTIHASPTSVPTGQLPAASAPLAATIFQCTTDPEKCSLTFPTIQAAGEHINSCHAGAQQKIHAILASPIIINFNAN